MSKRWSKRRSTSGHLATYLATYPAMLGLLATLASPPVLAAEPAAAASEPGAVEIAERVLDAMGGAEAWRETRFLRFDFFGFRLHHWDRHQGRHRFEGETRDGVGYLVLQDLASRQGEVWLGGERQQGEAEAEWLERAYEAWINDTYWLIMPYKLRDPGVRLAYDGSEEIDGTVYDKLHLSFAGVGLTPGDEYWAYVDRETGLMDRWAYHLQDWEDDRPATHWWWRDWSRHGEILLSPRRVKVDDGSERMLGELAVFDHLPDAVFESPEPVALD